MRFSDPQLRRCYESNLLVTGPSPDELRQIGALLAAHETFVVLAGERPETLEKILLGPTDVYRITQNLPFSH